MSDQSILEAQGYLDLMTTLHGLSRRMVVRAANLIGAGDQAAAAYYQDAITLIAEYAAEQPVALYADELRDACLQAIAAAAGMLEAFQQADPSSLSRARELADQATQQALAAMTVMGQRIDAVRREAVRTPPIA